LWSFSPASASSPRRVNAAIRNVAVIRAFRLWRYLLIPGAAALLFLFPLWGNLWPPAYTLRGVLPFMALGRVFMPADR
jgi:hypothetical protein